MITALVIVAVAGISMAIGNMWGTRATMKIYDEAVAQDEQRRLVDIPDSELLA